MGSTLKILSALVSGAVFGLGLSISQMIDPVKVLDFLDVLGNWDPSLALVMAGAVIVSGGGVMLASKRTNPLFDVSFYLPNRKDIDRRLICGAILFGIGWGMTGLCPGPALANLFLGTWQAVVFVGSMVAGMVLFKVLPYSEP